MIVLPSEFWMPGHDRFSDADGQVGHKAGDRRHYVVFLENVVHAIEARLVLRDFPLRAGLLRL